MEIINKKTGKRSMERDKKINKKLKKEDPIKRKAEKDLEDEEFSPMDPPDAYEGSKVEDVSYDEMHIHLQKFMDEHKVCVSKLDAFEKALVAYKENNYQLNDKINQSFSDFFQFFDNNIIDHNQREEKQLFGLLHKRLIESSQGEEGTIFTAVDMMEDDHIKFIQLGALTFNLLGLAPRLPDQRSSIFAYDVAYDNGRELIEMLRLHIFREDHILFPLAHKLISVEEFEELALAE